MVFFPFLSMGFSPPSGLVSTSTELRRTQCPRCLWSCEEKVLFWSLVQVDTAADCMTRATWNQLCWLEQSQWRAHLLVCGILDDSRAPIWVSHAASWCRCFFIYTHQPFLPYTLAQLRATLLRLLLFARMLVCEPSHLLSLNSRKPLFSIRYWR